MVFVTAFASGMVAYAAFALVRLLFVARMKKGPVRMTICTVEGTREVEVNPADAASVHAFFEILREERRRIRKRANLMKHAKYREQEFGEFPDYQTHAEAEGCPKP
jgi:hypothetical protein